MMDSLLYGLQITAVGMGTVFLLLAALMLLLMGLGRIDRPRTRRPLTEGLAAQGAVEAPAEKEAPSSPAADAAAKVTVHAHGLDDDLLAAITVAVTTHARLRRRQAAPETRAVAPGQLGRSRWLAAGRTSGATTTYPTASTRRS